MLFFSVPPVQLYENVSAGGFVRNVDTSSKQFSDYGSTEHFPESLQSGVNKQKEGVRNSYENIEMDNNTSAGIQEKFVSKQEKTNSSIIASQSQLTQHSSTGSPIKTEKELGADKAIRKLYENCSPKSKRTSAANSADLYTVIDKAHKKHENL